MHFGEFGRAATFFSKAINLNPEVSRVGCVGFDRVLLQEAEYFFQRAVVSGRLDMHKQQREDLEKTLGIDPNHAG